MAERLSPAVRARIVELAQSGKGRNEIAADVGCGLATVTRTLQAEGVTPDWSNPKKATEAKQDYNQANRIKLVNRGFDKLAALLDDVVTVGQAQTWTVAVATLIDKRRLEDGEATSRSDDISTGTAREHIARRLDELSARRSARDAAVGVDPSAAR